MLTINDKVDENESILYQLDASVFRKSSMKDSKSEHLLTDFFVPKYNV